MPLSRRVAEINRYVTNPLARLVAGRVPPFVLIEHRGRRSGRQFRTPVMGWIANNELSIALTYGPDVDWVKNLQSAGGGRVISRGRTLTIGPPRLDVGIEHATAIPAFIRRVLHRLRNEDYLRAPVISGPPPERTTTP